MPKSADRYEFDFIDVQPLSPADGAATLCSITASAVATVLNQLPEPPDFYVGNGWRSS